MNIIKKIFGKILILFLGLGYPSVLIFWNKCDVKQTNEEWLTMWRHFD